MKKLLVIDGNSIINRTFYGVGLLSTKNGIYTNAIFGMINVVMKQVEAIAPDYCAVAFDVKAPTFRHKLYDEYKAGRHPTPEELLSQIPYAKKCMEALGIHVLELAGYEADDILGTLASMAEKEKCDAYVLTGDRDSLQLITDHTSVLLATNKETVLYDRNAFFREYGVDSSSFVDVKALMGDTSDHIPGVPGIGKVTALKLIADFGSLDKLYSLLPCDKLSKGVNEKLIAGKDSALLSRKLSKIYTEVPVISSLEEIPYLGIDKKSAYPLFAELEFTGFIKRFDLDKAESVPLDTEELKIVDKEKLTAFLAEKQLVAVCVCDGISFSDGDTAISFGGSLSEVVALLRDNKTDYVCYDCKSLYKKMRASGVEPFLAFHDVMLGAYVLDPAQNSFDFAVLCTKYLGRTPDKEDVRLLMPLYREIESRIHDHKQESLLYDIEMPLAAVLADMEDTGCRVDIDGLVRYGEKLSELESEYRERIYCYAGEEFNINSPKQLGEVLFEKMMLPTAKKTKTGYSTGADVLEKLRPYHPIVGDILDYRQVAKLRATYAEGLVKASDSAGRIHTNFKQTGTATGRLSSTEPNLQNIPIKTELGREFRRFFIPQNDDFVLIDADYSQIELRLLADISGDAVMRDAFLAGSDIHTSTAAKVFGIPPESVTPEMRKRAKAVNFGIVYGIGDFSLASDLGISRASAREYIDSYLSTYPDVGRYLHDVVENAKKNGYVTTSFGRRRYIPELAESNKIRRAFGERVAMNSPIQGTAADIIKIAMIRVSEKLRENHLNARLVLQVHDELLVEASRDCAREAEEILRSEMENAVKVSVPLDVEVGAGSTWFECH